MLSIMESRDFERKLDSRNGQTHHRVHLHFCLDSQPCSLIPSCCRKKVPWGWIANPMISYFCFYFLFEICSFSLYIYIKLNFFLIFLLSSELREWHHQRNCCFSILLLIKWELNRKENYPCLTDINLLNKQVY